MKRRRLYSVPLKGEFEKLIVRIPLSEDTFDGRTGSMGPETIANTLFNPISRYDDPSRDGKRLILCRILCFIYKFLY